MVDELIPDEVKAKIDDVSLLRPPVDDDAPF